jgi:hypothetical protein
MNFIWAEAKKTGANVVCPLYRKIRLHWPKPNCDPEDGSSKFTYCPQHNRQPLRVASSWRRILTNGHQHVHEDDDYAVLLQSRAQALLSTRNFWRKFCITQREGPACSSVHTHLRFPLRWNSTVTQHGLEPRIGFSRHLLMSCRNKRSRQNRSRGFGDTQTHVHQTFICVYSKRNTQNPTYKITTCLTYISRGPGEVNPEMTNCGRVHGRGGQLRCTQTPAPRTQQLERDGKHSHQFSATAID